MNNPYPYIQSPVNNQTPQQQSHQQQQTGGQGYNVYQPTTTSTTLGTNPQMYPPLMGQNPQQQGLNQPQLYPNITQDQLLQQQQLPQGINPLQQQQQQLQDIQQQLQQQPQQQQQQKADQYKNFNKMEEIKKLFDHSMNTIKSSVINANNLPSPMPQSRRLDPSQHYNDSQTLPTMSLEKMIAFPNEITQRLLQTPSISALFGIYPEITRVWLVIDNVMYLWNYVTGKFTRFNISHVVNHTILMAPKKDVFSDQVSKIIVFCTFAEIFLNPILFSNSSNNNSNNNNSMDDQECEIMLGLSIPTDGLSITAIVGTKDGRIYFAGDGYIYEIEYSRNSLSYLKDQKIRKSIRTSSLMSNFWMKKRPEITQLLYDEQQHNLYALSVDNKVTIYNIKGTTFTEICVFEPAKDWALDTPRFQQQHFQQQQQQFQQQQFQQFPNNNIQQQQQQFQLQQQQQQQQQLQQQKNIKVDALSIHLTPDDNPLFEFLVVLNNGARMYYSTKSYNPNGSNQSQYQFVRLPPISMMHQNAHNAITSSFYCKGVFITSAQIEDSTDRVTGVTLFNLAQIKKSFEPSSVPSTAQEDYFCEKPNFFNIQGRVIEIKEEVNISYKSLNVPYYKDLVVEHTTSPRRFLLLTSHGLHIITKMRYVDILENLISNNKEASVFMNEIGQSVGLSLCIELYCQNPQSSIIANEQNYAGLSLPRTISPRVSNLTLVYLKQMSGRPKMAPNNMGGGGGLGYAVNNAQYIPSTIFQALQAYTGRMVSIFWNQPMVYSNGSSRWSLNQLKTFQSHIQSLLSYMEVSSLVPPLSQKSSEINILLETRIETDEDAVKRERRALIGLRETLLQAIQVMNLFIIFQEHNDTKPDYSSVSRDVKQTNLDAYQFQEYVDDQKSVIRSLIDSYLQRILDLNYRVDIASNRLSQDCPHFYKQEDKEFQNAKMYLNEAKKGTNINYNISLAIEILNKIAPLYDYNQILQDLKSLGQINLITPLLLNFSRQLENQYQLDNINSNNNNTNSNSNIENELKKGNVYNEIIQILNDLSDDSRDDRNQVKQIRAQQTIDEIITYCLNYTYSEKKLLESVYTWIIGQNGISKLMELDFNSPYLVEFLRDQHPQICWKFLQKNQKNLDASSVLCSIIAENSKNLDEKIQCYRDSLMVLNECQDSVQYLESKFLYFLSTTQRSLVEELERIIQDDTAQQQQQQLSNLIQDLQCNLVDINRLFEISKQYYLHELMLIIANYGNHDNPQFFKILWKIIIEKVVEQYRPNGLDLESIGYQIKEKIIKYGFTFYPNEISFPLDYIINLTEHIYFNYCRNACSTLEGSSSQIRLVDSIPGNDWLAVALHDSIKIDYWILVDIYKNIIEFQGTDSWKSDDELFYIIHVFINLLESLINSTSTSYTERRLFSSKQFRSTVKQFEDKLNRIQDKSKPEKLKPKIQRITSMLQALENSY